MSSAWTVGGVGAMAIQCGVWGGAGEALFPEDRVPGTHPPTPPPALPSPSQSFAPASGKEVGISPFRARPEPMAATASVGSR